MRDLNLARALLVGAMFSIGASQFNAASRFVHAQDLEEETTGDRSRDDVFRGTANLEPVSHLDVRSETGQPVAIKWVAPEGKVVKKGTLLVELDASAFLERREQQEVTVEKTRAQLALAERSLAQAGDESSAIVDVAEQGLVVAEGALKSFLSKQGEYALEVRTVEGKIAVAAKRLEVATARLRRLKTDEEAQLGRVEAETELAAAKGRHRYLTEHFRAQRIGELKLAVAQSRLDLIRARHGASHAQGNNEVALFAIRSDLKLELGRLARLEKQIAACRIHAPQAGTVIYPQMPRRRPTAAVRPDAAGRTGIRRGAMVRDDQVLLRLVDQTRFKLELRVGLPIAQRVMTGQPVTIQVDAFPQRAFRGRVTRVAVAPERRRPPVEGLITVRLDDATGKLRAGMSTVVELELSEKAKQKK